MTSSPLVEDAQPCAVFVYGTLKRGQQRANLWPHAPLDVQVATLRARLFDLGPYPAIVEGNDLVEGELWFFQEGHFVPTLQRLDWIEGYAQPGGRDLYVRRVVECSGTNGQSVSAFAYFYANVDALPGDSRRVAASEDGRCRWVK